MRLRKLFISFVGLGAIAGTVGAVVACGKTANATLPVEFVIPSENYAFRSDRGDARTVPGYNAWATFPAASAKPEQAVFQSSVAPGIVSALKSILASYIGNYADLDPKWKPLFDDANAQRDGSGSTMVEMSRIYMADSGVITFPEGQTEVKKDEKGSVKFTLITIMYDGYATTGNSPAESYAGLLPYTAGHHWEIDLTPDPIVLNVQFTNKSDTPVTTISNVNFSALDSYVISASSVPLTQDEYRAIVAQVPNASNYYKTRLSDADFKKIFGSTVAPVKKTS